jgi:hypothetical protein
MTKGLFRENTLRRVARLAERDDRITADGRELPISSVHQTKRANPARRHADTETPQVVVSIEHLAAGRL